MEALAAVGGVGTVGFSIAVVVMAFKLLAAKNETMAARDLLVGERRVSAEWESKYKSTTAALKVTRTRMEQSENLRAVAEAQRNAAQERVRELIRTHLPRATNEEIQELTDEAFSSPLSVVPRAPSDAERVPQVPRSQDARDGLLDPFGADLQPPKPA